MVPASKLSTPLNCRHNISTATKPEKPSRSFQVSTNNDTSLGDTAIHVNTGNYSDAVKICMTLAEQGSVKALEKTAEFLKLEPFADAMATFLENPDIQSRPGALYIRGWMHHEGIRVSQDDNKAFTYFKLSADQGYAPAQCQLGSMYENGRAIRQDEKVVEREYDTGSPEYRFLTDQYDLGWKYHHGSDGYPKNFAKAVKHYKVAAESGFCSAQYNLGCLYKEGSNDVPRDDKEAVKYFQYAARQGYGPAWQHLASIYIAGDNNVPRDDQEALTCLKLAVGQGNTGAQHNLKWLYTTGRVDIIYRDEAVLYYSLAADQGHVRAQFNLAMIYHEGRGDGKKMPLLAHHRFMEVANQDEDLVLKLKAQEIIEKFYIMPAHLKESANREISTEKCVVQ